jgi:hypothetical protein
VPKKRPHEHPQSLDFGPFGPRSLKEVYQYIDFSPNVSPKHRDDVLGALLMLARIHAAVKDEAPLQILARIPTNVPLLRNWLKRLHGKRHMYSDGGLANMRSQIFKGVRTAGVKVREGRRRIKLPAPWQTLIDLLDPDSRLLIVLHPFFRWCVQEGLQPDQLSQSVFEHYERYLCDFDGRSRDPRDTYSTVVKAWETARILVAGWPPIPIGILDRRDILVLPQTSFGFSDELDRMMIAAQNPDPLFPRRRKRINAVTAKHQTEQLLRLASALVHETECTPASITSIRQLVTPTAAHAALRHLTAREYQRQLARKRRANPDVQE